MLKVLHAERVRPVRAQLKLIEDLGPRSRTVLLRLSRLDDEATRVARAIAVLGERAEQYNGWFTYRALTARSGSNGEYLTVWLRGSHCTGLCLDRDGPALTVSAYDGTHAPTSNKFGTVDLGPETANPEIVWTADGSTNVWPDPLFNGTSTAFDFTFQTQGNYTIDASKDPPALGDLLNSLCADAAHTSCKFTATGAPTFGPGPITALPAKYHCPTKLSRRPGRPGARYRGAAALWRS